MDVRPEELVATLVERARARRLADEADGARLLAAVRAALPPLCARLGIRRAWLIGTLAWGGFGLRSDVDVVLDGADDRSSRTIAEELERLTDCAVDALILEKLDEGFRQRVLAEGLLVA